jgi:hypothetical protein
MNPLFTVEVCRRPSIGSPCKGRVWLSHEVPCTGLGHEGEVWYGKREMSGLQAPEHLFCPCGLFRIC